METYEKDILKREITDEVKEDLTHYAGKNIKWRIVVAFAIAGVEIIFWTGIIALASQTIVRDFAFMFAMCFCALRWVQMSMIKEFGND